jgi:hypothetical protein
MKENEKKDTEMYKGALQECQLWKDCLSTGMTYPSWRKRHFTKKEDKESVRKLMKAYEEVELYLQNKLK